MPSLKRVLSVGDIDSLGDASEAFTTIKKARNSKSKKPKPLINSQPVSGRTASVRPASSVDETIDDVIANHSSTDVDVNSSLVLKIKQLHVTVAELQTQVNFLLSFVGITVPPPPSSSATLTALSAVDVAVGGDAGAGPDAAPGTSSTTSTAATRS
jgi:hypothetical protein